MLEDGNAHELLKKVDDRERPGRTWCIGVNWDFERKDLLEIVDVRSMHPRLCIVANSFDFSVSAGMPLRSFVK